MPADETRQGGTAVATTEFVTSRDGTRIAFDRMGAGPPIILVAGAFGNRSWGNPVGALLAPHFTVFNYDRRGRNESDDTLPYAVEREVEDIGALIAKAGGSASVFGMSSGAVLALDAAAHSPAIKKLALYEPPLLVDDSRPPVPADYRDRLKQAIAAGRPGDAVEYFLTVAVQVPAEFVAQMRNDEATWSGLEAVAHTLPYDAAIMEGLMIGKPLPTQRTVKWATITAPTLVLVGGATFPFMHSGAKALAEVLPNARSGTLEGQSHDVKPEVLAPALIDFFEDRS